MPNYLEKAIAEIREVWFNGHVITNIKGNDEIQEITLGKPNTSTYQLQCTLVDNMVYIRGDVGIATLRLTEPARIETLKDYALDYFVSKIVTSERELYEFDAKKARKEIHAYFLAWCEVDDMDALDVDDKQLYKQIMYSITMSRTIRDFEQRVYDIYKDTSVEWFDAQASAELAESGKQISYSVIAYWVGLQMIAEQQAGISKPIQKQVCNECYECKESFVADDTVVVIQGEPYHAICVTLQPAVFEAFIGGEPLGITDNGDGEEAYELIPGLINEKEDRHV